MNREISPLNSGSNPIGGATTLSAAITTHPELFGFPKEFQAVIIADNTRTQIQERNQISLHSLQLYKHNQWIPVLLQVEYTVEYFEFSCDQALALHGWYLWFCGILQSLSNVLKYESVKQSNFPIRKTCVNWLTFVYKTITKTQFSQRLFWINEKNIHPTAIKIKPIK